MAIPPVVDDALRRRRNKAIRTILIALEAEAPSLAAKGHPVRRAVMREINDVHDITRQLIDSVARDDIALNELWILQLDDLTRTGDDR